MITNLENFHLPTYREIPTVGLYLEQTVRYINESLHPLDCIEVTSSMISNYIKKGYVPRPIKKQYNAELIADLIFIVIVKQVLSMENIGKLLEQQKDLASTEKAYDYFCHEFEETLLATFKMKTPEQDIVPDAPAEIRILRSAVIAATHIIYLSHCFDEIAFNQSEEDEE